MGVTWILGVCNWVTGGGGGCWVVSWWGGDLNVGEEVVCEKNETGRNGECARKQELQGPYKFIEISIHFNPYIARPIITQPHL